VSLIKSGFWFALGTLFSRLFGLLRESVIAGVFGASVAMDAFLVANRIPNMLRELFAEGALGSSFTKVFSEFWEKDQERARQLLRDSLLFFSLLSLIVTLLGILGAPWLVEAMTMKSPSSGEEAESAGFFLQATDLTRLLFPFIGMMMVASVTAGALHQKGRFLLSAVSPVALNLGYLAGALLFARWLSLSGPSWVLEYTGDQAITGLALGVLAGGFAQVALQLWGLWRPFFKGHRLMKFSSVTGFSSDLKKVLWLMGPMVLASSAGQVNVLVNTNFATSLGTGAVTWLSFAFRLLQLPIGIFAVAVSSVALPSFSRLLSRGSESRQQVSAQLFQACELMVWLMAACFCFFAVNSHSVIQLLFQQGAFSAADSRETADALFYYSFGLVGYGLVKVLISYYYAKGRTGYAMKISFLSIALNLLLNWMLVQAFGHRGLAMTASMLLTVNALGLIWGLRGDGLSLPIRNLARGGLFLMLAATSSLVLTFLTFGFLSTYLQFSEWNLKIKSAVILLVDGTLVTVIFGGLGCLRCRLSPSQAFSRLRRQG